MSDCHPLSGISSFNQRWRVACQKNGLKRDKNFLSCLLHAKPFNREAKRHHRETGIFDEHSRSCEFLVVFFATLEFELMHAPEMMGKFSGADLALAKNFLKQNLSVA